VRPLAFEPRTGDAHLHAHTIIEEPGMSTTVQLVWDDGTDARWVVTEEQAEAVASLLGPPDTMIL
jgi:hypothetical protein